MPTTPNSGIYYPCADSQITCDDFEKFAQTSDTALAAVGALENRALHRPIAQARRVQLNTPTFAQGATTDMSFDQRYIDNMGTMIPTVGVGATNPIVVRRGGVYLLTLYAGTFLNTTTLTSYSYIIRRNGADLIRRKYPGVGTGLTTVAPGSVQGIALLAVSDTIGAAFHWTGTGGPATDGIAYLSAKFICDPS